MERRLTPIHDSLRSLRAELERLAAQPERPAGATPQEVASCRRRLEALETAAQQGRADAALEHERSLEKAAEGERRRERQRSLEREQSAAAVREQLAVAAEEAERNAAAAEAQLRQLQDATVLLPTPTHTPTLSGDQPAVPAV